MTCEHDLSDFSKKQLSQNEKNLGKFGREFQDVNHQQSV